jgi:hypothetical protein
LAALLLASCVWVISANDGPARHRQRPKAYLNMPARFPVKAGDWLAVEAFPNLRFQNATFVTRAPRSPLLFVCEREGKIKAFENRPEVRTTTLVLDLSSSCQGHFDCGLLGLAFHPEFGKPGSPNRGYFYVFYNWTETPIKSPPPTTPTWARLSRFTIPDGTLTADLSSELVLIDQYDELASHNGGSMFFHPQDGYLYVSLGDEGITHTDMGNCQRIDRDLFSGVIRIDVDMDAKRGHAPPRQPSSGMTANYFIPNDNPFVGVPGALEEFWCLGLRSPHRMSYDAPTKRLWLADVGEEGGGKPCEEINLIIKGGNYQWNYREGTSDTRHMSRPQKPIGVEQEPVYAYPHSNEGDNCVIGGYVYRGQEHAEQLGGQYLFGDWGTGRIWAMEYVEGKPPLVRELCTLPPRHRELSSFGVDANDELYMCSTGDAPLYKLARAESGSPPLPSTLSASGAFQDVRSLTLAEGFLPYEVNCPSFSDGADKYRWMFLPRDGKITFAQKGEWTFPEGTVFVKHFTMSENGKPRRLETRLLVCDSLGGAYGACYKWRPDNSDADLLTTSVSEKLPNGQTWFYPGPADCLRCHTANAGSVLGVNARQLNRGTGEQNQLAVWNKLLLFDHLLTQEELAGCRRLTDIGDVHVDVNERVHSYLDVNCGHCHRPYGVRAKFDARYESIGRNLIDGPVLDDLGIAAARVVAPGDPARSLLLQRLLRCDDRKMPPLGRNIVDNAAVTLFTDWIVPPKPSRLPVFLLGLALRFAAAMAIAMCLRRWLAQSQNVLVARYLGVCLALIIAGSVPLFAAFRATQYANAHWRLAACGSLLLVAVLLTIWPRWRPACGLSSQPPG